MIWPWQRSIQARIVLILAGLLSGVLLLVNLEMARYLSQSQLEESANHLQIQTLLAARSLQDPLSEYGRELEDDDHDRKDPAPLLPDWTARYTQESGTRVLVVNGRGDYLAGDKGELDPSEQAAAELGQSVHRWTDDSIYASAPVIRHERLLGVVRLSLGRGPVSARSFRLSLRLAAASLLALGLALLAATWLSRRVVAPLKELESSARKAAQGHWDDPVELPGQDELASLSRAFAGMLSELRAMLDRQRLFIGSASHELRTPLTRIKLRSEALASACREDPQRAEKFARELDSEVDGLITLANSLLDLARLEEGPESTMTADTLAVVRAALDSCRASAEDKGLTLQVELPESLPPLRLAPLNLQSLLENLLNNAVKYTPAGGKVGLLAERTQGGIRVQVEDTGIGIEPHHLDRIFERFYRVDSARGKGGTGLGLTLVKAAVEAAGGTIKVSSQPGQGSRFTVDLPGC